MTVIIGAYNAQAYVAATLASVREQSHDDFTVVVVDAGSTDATAEVVALCAADDRRIRLVRSPRHLSAPEARNAALAEVQTEFVATLDADDLMLPHRLAHQLNAFDTHPETLAFGGMLRVVDDHGLPLRADGPVPTDPFRDPSSVGLSPSVSPVTIAYTMPFFSPFLASAGMYRTAALRRLGGFDEASPWADDYTTIWRLSQLGEVRKLPRFVGEYRRHRESVSRRRSYSQRMEVALLRQRIAAAIMGRAPNVTSVLAWTTPLDQADPKAIAKARDELTEFHEAFVARHAINSEDAGWIWKFHQARLALLAAS